MSTPDDRDPCRASRRPVILLTAGMGAGHDGAATQLAERLHDRGFPTVTLRLRDLLPVGFGAAINGFYRWMILRAPWLYRFIYRSWLKPGWRSERVSPVAALAERRLERVVREVDPAAVVSTFHVCSQTLGIMRSKGTLGAPAASLVVDFAAHATWVNPGVDLHLCLHPGQAARVRALGAPWVEVTGPVVAPRFQEPVWDRSEARRTLGLADGDTVVLVVAGSWGAGDVVATAESLVESGAFRVLVAAGHNASLLRRLAGLGPLVKGVGWVEDFDRLIAASDVVVENAGGLSAMEAMAAGRPVISYLPIPGHGVDNVAWMGEAGLTVYAGSAEELRQWVERLSTDSSERRRAISLGRAMFRGDATECIEKMIGGSPTWADPDKPAVPSGTRGQSTPLEGQPT